MSDLTTRSREAAQRDIAMAALVIIAAGGLKHMDSIARKALFDIAEIEATKPSDQPPSPGQ